MTDTSTRHEQFQQYFQPEQVYTLEEISATVLEHFQPGKEREFQPSSPELKVPFKGLHKIVVSTQGSQIYTNLARIQQLPPWHKKDSDPVSREDHIQGILTTTEEHLCRQVAMVAEDSQCRMLLVCA